VNEIQVGRIEGQQKYITALIKQKIHTSSNYGTQVPNKLSIVKNLIKSLPEEKA